jgi:adenylate cyclase class 2
MPKLYEVELKFRIETVRPIEVELQQIGAVETDVVFHNDRYFNHPSRDFRSTDEAFRIRSIGEANCVTYKGAVQGSVAKTRHEIEVEFAEGAEASAQLFNMVQLLGFRFVREVHKSRRSYTLSKNRFDFVLAVDDVPGLGRFLEIELLAENEQREAAEAAVWELARHLKLTVAEPRSYLDLLLESDGSLK